MAKSEKINPTEGTPSAAMPSKRDSFRGRISKRYPDLNMDDEDAYYDRMNNAMDEYEGYEANSRRLRESMERSPVMAEMLLAAKEQDDFDPVVWMVSNKGLDLQALQDDPEYSEKLAQAHADYLTKNSKGKEIEEAMKTNMPKSVEDVRAKAEELGLSDEQAEEIVGKMYQVMDDLVHGIISIEVFESLAKGQNHDADVKAAREEGMAEGLNTRVDDKLRTLNKPSEHISGAQTPAKQAAPKKRANNMFLDDDFE